MHKVLITVDYCTVAETVYFNFIVCMPDPTFMSKISMVIVLG